SIAHRSIHVSYPNAADKAQAKSRGVNPGGDIMIHGQMNGFGHLAGLNQQHDWTDGCIAVTNDEMDEIMAAVKVGTAIEIVE
ncbi:L,D-transpeptidase family protein, partial [Psychrobacter sp. TB55-MNA-CIBAN-0194]|uniref:L,D-transpeptidase family protein n=1 Tax=Psychrobacter sp. TB55-MNA-CIBAN-0194 TaxID=3140445 RepID=UPI00331EA99B